MSLHLHSLPFLPLADLSALIFFFRFPTLSPLKSFPTRPLLRDGSDLPRLIRWDDYEELPQRENIAPLKSAVMVSKRQRYVRSSCASFDSCCARRVEAYANVRESKWQDEIILREIIYIFPVSITAVSCHLHNTLKN